MRANRDANMPRNVVATCKVMVPTEVERAAGFKPGGAEEFLYNFLFPRSSLSSLLYSALKIDVFGFAGIVFSSKCCH